MKLFDDKLTIPVISLWQPWAQWVIFGWKPIETRKHRRFVGLVGGRIGIHAADYWDPDWREAFPYMRIEWLGAMQEVPRLTYGALIGTVHVAGFRPLHVEDSRDALIDCDERKIQRYGLLLSGQQQFETPIRMKGKQGIWHVDLTEHLQIESESTVNLIR